MMRPGRELDALVGTKIMGYEYNHTSGVDCPTCGYDGLYDTDKTYPGYSTDIAAAWEVVEKLDSLEDFEFRMESDQGELIKWHVEFHKLSDGQCFPASEHSAALAICLAALKALEVEAQPHRASGL
jgi:hypothetical protein